MSKTPKITDIDNGIRIPVRNLLKYSKEQLNKDYKSDAVVLFDDKEVVMTSGEIILLRFQLDTYLVPKRLINNIPMSTNDYTLLKVPHSKYLDEDRYFIDVGINSDLVASNYYSSGIPTNSTINSIFSAIYKRLVLKFIHKHRQFQIIPQVFKTMQFINTDIFNMIALNNLKYVSSISYKNVLDIQFDDELIEAIKKVAETKEASDIQLTYDVLDKVMLKPEHKNNPLALGYNSGNYNVKQIRQMLASRGKVTDIESKIYTTPVASSFALGLNDVTELMLESSPARKALYLSNKGVPLTEYFAREMQLVSAILGKLDYNDCGATKDDFTDWYVRSANMANGKSDLRNLEGAQFYVPETGEEGHIDNNMKQLEGKYIKIRTAHSCKTKDPTRICIGCLGMIGYNIFPHTALGYMSTTTLTQLITQIVLSTKHLTSTAIADAIRLNDISKKFFSIKNKNKYAFKTGILNRAKTKYKIIISQKEGFGLENLTAENVTSLGPERVSRIESFILVEENKDKILYHPIIIKENKKEGSFTTEFLEYISKKGLMVDNEDNYIIDLNEWSTKPFMIIPEVEYNYLTYSENIKKEFKSRTKTASLNETPEVFTQKLFDLVNSKLDLNISWLSVITYAYTIGSLERNDYGLSRFKKGNVVRMKDIIQNRSLGVSLPWEYISEVLFSPNTFYGNNAISYPLDAMLKPEETIKEYEGK